MKNLLIIAVMFLSHASCGQSAFEFSQIDTIAASKSDLFVRALSWMSKVFKSSKTVIQMQDKESGRIIGKAAIVWRYRFMGDGCVSLIHYTITIDVKDNKARIALSDFHHQGCTYAISGGRSQGYLDDGGSLSNADQPWKGGLKKRKQNNWDEIRQTAKAEATLLLASFRSEMQSPKLSTSDF